MQPEEDGGEPQVRECGRCQERNEPGAFYCSRCGYALDSETTAELEDETTSDVKTAPLKRMGAVE